MTVAIERELEDFSRGTARGASILDVGCGNRPYQKFFAHCEYLGIDVEKSGRELADKQADLFYDGENIPFPDARFQAALCTQVFEHCQNPAKLIREIHRVLAPSGRFFFSVPFIWGEHEVPFDFRRFTSFGCKKFLEENGFRVVKQIRADGGVDALRALVSSEITFCRAHGLERGGGYAAPFFDKLAWRLFNNAMRIWAKRFPFPRLYLDNIVMAERS